MVGFGIIVKKQIVDEMRWFLAMEEIKELFKNKDYFVELPVFDKATFGEENLRMLNVTETFNFGKQGKDFSWDWISFSNFISFERRRDVENGRISLKEALTLEIEMLQMKSKTDSRVYQRFNEQELKTVLKLLEHNGNEIFESQAFHHPPVLYRFCVGEYPQLPVFGRHFKHCFSKISSSDGTKTMKIIQEIFKVINRYFPGSVEEYWDGNLVEEETGREPVLFKSQESEKTRRMFYSSACILFKDVTDQESVHLKRGELASQTF